MQVIGPPLPSAALQTSTLPPPLASPSVIPPRSVTAEAPPWDHAATPSWFEEMQRQAWHEFTELPLPSRRNESWRFADLAQLNFEAFVSAPEAESALVKSLIARSRGLATTAGRIIFINDRLVHVDASLAKSGLRLETLPNGFETAKHLLNSLAAPLGSAKFVALHQAHLRNAVVCTVPKNLTLSDPIEIFHWATGEHSTIFPRTLVHTEENARVSIVEHHRSANGDTTFSCGATQLVASGGSHIDYVLCQQWNVVSKNIHMSATHCARDSKVSHCLANLGAAWSRTECVSHLEGPGSRSDMLSVSLTDENQESDQRTLQLHHAPHAQSDLLYKNVLFGRSRNIFAGLIRVDHGAHFTDAYQTCRNLLMTDDCEANAMPGLEINADQVKCSHGSTSGSIDPEEIFYFESRGIPPEAARALLAEGFLAQTLSRISNATVREFLLQAVAQRFAAAHHDV